jgi:methylmalonyl-CoA mutase
MSWLSQLEKDLKGKPLSTLDWTVEPGIVVKPFYTREDFESLPPAGPVRPDGGNAWRICERLDASDADLANARALEALNYGADMLWFDLPDGTTADHLERLLKGIHLSFVFSAFCTDGPCDGLRTMLPPQTVPYEGVFLEKKNKKALWSDGREGVFLDGRERAGATVQEQLRALMQDAANGFQEWKAGGSAGEFGRSAFVALPVGDHYLVEIAKLRAFKTLWEKWSASVGADYQLPHLHVETTNAHADEHANMIAAATQALSAAVAGVHSLGVRPANNGSDAFHRRIARNVQHLLQMESGVDRVGDPAAGSYFLEKLTRMFVDAV